MIHCTATEVYIQTPNYCTYQSKKQQTATFIYQTIALYVPTTYIPLKYQYMPCVQITWWTSKGKYPSDYARCEFKGINHVIRSTVNRQHWCQWQCCGPITLGKWPLVKSAKQWPIQQSTHTHAQMSIWYTTGSNLTKPNLSINQSFKMTIPQVKIVPNQYFLDHCTLLNGKLFTICPVKATWLSPE